MFNLSNQNPFSVKKLLPREFPAISTVENMSLAYNKNKKVAQKEPGATKFLLLWTNIG
jgi:hypothetical protein